MGLGFEKAFEALKDANEQMYWDTCEVMRRLTIKDNTTKANVVHSEIIGRFPCRLSGTPPSAKQGEPNTQFTFACKLYCGNDADIKEGDRLTVIRQAGDTMKFTADGVYRYRSHTEVLLQEARDA